MSCTCPLCNSAIDQTLGVKLLKEANLVVWANGYCNLTQSQFLLFEKIHNAYPNRISLERLAMLYYVNCRDPDNPPADDLIRVQISLIRKKLREAGSPINIPTIKTYGVGYRTEIEKDNEEEVA